MTSRWMMEVEKVRDRRRHLVGDEPGGAQRGRATCPTDYREHDGPRRGARSGSSSPPPRSTATRSSSRSTTPWAPASTSRREGLRRGHRGGARGGRPARRARRRFADHRRGTTTPLRGQPPARHRPRRRRRRHAGHRGQRRRVLRPGRQPGPQGRGRRPALGRLRARGRARPASSSSSAPAPSAPSSTDPHRRLKDLTDARPHRRRPRRIRPARRPRRLPARPRATR